MILTKSSLLIFMSLFYIISMIWVYFSKERIHNDENKMFRFILITNLVGLNLQLLCILCSYYYDFWNQYFCDFVFKLYSVQFLIFVIGLLMYLIVISFKKYDKILKIIMIITVIISVITFLLPLDLYVSDDKTTFFTYGLSVNFVYAISLVISTLIIGILFLKGKKIDKKKKLPLYTYIIFGLCATMIQKVNPELVIMGAVETYLCCMMYFTIENPDMAMIEQLNIARDQADKANQAKSEFLSSMSHEIRTPLNAIVGFSQALQEEDLPSQAQEEVKDIVRASESLLELVNGILDISKIEANKIEIVDGEYNIYDILNDLVALTKARMGDKPLKFETYFDQSIPQVLYGDSVRIKQVILNLLTNSVKYTKEGEIIFRVSSIQANDVCRLIISVEDTGIGIKQESIDKLFTKFQRLDLEKNKTIEGTGLGLAITKKLVDLMNGRIMVQSVYGKGSKFTVALDQKIIYKTVTSIPKQEKVVEEIADLSGKKVLIVDDNKLNLKVASRLIEKYNCEIVTAESGFECLDRINKQEHFDLILMDDMMPEMSGVETLRKLKENPMFNTPVIALTANAITGMKEKYLADGFNDYLSKPIDKQELNKLLQNFLKN